MVALFIRLLFSILAIQEPSRWSRRTAKRRAQTGRVLSSISLPSSHRCLGTNNIGTSFAVPILNAPEINWINIDPLYDPQEGGRLRPDSPRARRKRRQVEAFAHVIQEFLRQRHERQPHSTITVVDAGSGAGNLSLGLAGALKNKVDEICAVDVNERALERLAARAQLPTSTATTASRPRVVTVCADLASPSLRLPRGTLVLCSLHACGAATDMAIRLATRNHLPFCVSPCCIAKSVTSTRASALYGPSASKQRSAAPHDITYPRSRWLRSELKQVVLQHQEGAATMRTPESYYYELLAKTADVGLGPQTPVPQRVHQQVAKTLVELDRLCHVEERYGYKTRLLRLRDHEHYGKAELLLGAPAGSSAAESMFQLETM